MNVIHVHVNNLNCFFFHSKLLCSLLGPELHFLLKVKEDTCIVLIFQHSIYCMIDKLPGSMQYLWSKISSL